MQVRVIAICAVVLMLSIGQAFGANPVGNLEYVHPDDLEFAGGWAYDADSPGTSLQVHFYREGAVFIGATTCNIYRPDVYGGGYYGFRWRVPYTLYDGGNHTIYAYAYNVGPGSNAQLTNSPKAIHKAYCLSSDDARVVISLDCGGGITQMYHSSDFSKNMVLSHPGGLVQAAVYDGNSQYWNIVQASDKYHHYSGVVDWDYDSQTNTLYTKTRGLQWHPERWGGDAGTPVQGDCYIEQWAQLDDEKLYMTYRVYNIYGSSHGSAYQEFPCMFWNGSYDTAVTRYNANYWLQDYSGYEFPDSIYHHYSTEEWFGACDSNGIGPNFVMKDDDPYAFYHCHYSYEPGGAFGYMNTPISFGIPGYVGATVTRECCFYIGEYTDARAFALNY